MDCCYPRHRCLISPWSPLEVEAAADEITAFAAELVCIPTVNPLGEEYCAAAELIADHLRRAGMEVEFFQVSQQTEGLPRPNVVGILEGDSPGPCVHFNGHFGGAPPPPR